MDDKKQQFVLVDSDNTIQGVILVRGNEFYCFEHCDDAPQNFAELQREYPECRVLPVALSTIVEQKAEVVKRAPVSQRR